MYIDNMTTADKLKMCLDDGCGELGWKEGLCRRHFKMREKLQVRCAAPCTPPCDREVFGKQLCYSHYRRQYRGQSLDTPLESREGLFQLPGPKVTAAVAKSFKDAATSQGISQFELMRRLVHKWYGGATGQIID